jgi:hypothetical protein
MNPFNQQFEEEEKMGIKTEYPKYFQNSQNAFVKNIQKK